MRFLYTILQKLNTLQEGNAVNQQIFPLLAKRLSDLGNLLEQASVENSSDTTEEEHENSIERLENEVIANGIPQKALAELANPLYEKVICNIPFLLLDSSKKLVSQDNLNKIRYNFFENLKISIELFASIFLDSGGLTFQKDETVEGKLSSDTKNYGGLNMEVIPSKSGLAEIDLKFEDKVIQVRPSTAFIRPLSLDPIRKSPRNSKVQLVTI